MTVLQTIAVAFAMFSALPVPQFEWNEKNMRYAMCAFPLIGLVCGGLWCLCGVLPLPELARAAAFCLVPVAVTGGIHLDGYADTSDALSSYGDREKKLEILKDSHCGAFAVIRLCCYFAAYFGLCGSVRFTPRAGLCWTLALVLERALSGFAVAAFPLAKDTGLAHTFATAADKQTVRRFLCGLSALLILALTSLGGGGLAAAALLAEGEYDDAKSVFEALKDYADAEKMAKESAYQKGEKQLADGQFDDAKATFESLEDYADAQTKAKEAVYQKGEKLLAAKDYDGAIAAYQAAGDYSDATTKAREAQYQKGESLIAVGDYDGAAAYYLSIEAYSWAQEAQYAKGERLLAAGDYDGATAAYQAAGDYSDASMKAKEAQYAKGESLLAEQDNEAAAQAFASGVGYRDALKRSYQIRYRDLHEGKIAAGGYHAVGLKADRMVVATGYNWYGECKVSGWTDIVSIAAGGEHTVGLKADGTVVATGENGDGRCNVSGWTDIGGKNERRTENKREEKPIKRSLYNENEYEVTGVAPFKVNIDIDENGKVVSVSAPQK